MDNLLNEQAIALVWIHVVDAEEFSWIYFTYNEISSLKSSIILVENIFSRIYTLLRT